ncbi:MAG: hypothetical protein WC295_14615, partial [Methanoregula sp.]
CGGATLPLLILFDALHMTSFYYTSDVSITNIYTIWKEVSFHLIINKTLHYPITEPVTGRSGGGQTRERNE